jgi:hypothetical protein
MPDDPRSSSSPATSGEFNFDDSPPVESPRIKRRSLNRRAPAPQPAAEEPEPPAREPEPDRLEATASAPAATPPSAETPAPTRPAPYGATTSSYRPSAPSPSVPTQNSGLYYSAGARREPERPSTPTPPMKPSTSIPSSTGAALASPVSAFRPQTGSTPRASTASDFRANIDRQSREQKSVGDVLTYIVYAIGALLVISAALAIYGGYTLSRQIHQQSVTVSDLDARYAAENKTLNAALGATDDALAEAQAQLHRQEDMITRQQDTINKLVVTNDEIVNALKAERLTRASETANLRARVRSLEDETTPAR